MVVYYLRPSGPPRCGRTVTPSKFVGRARRRIRRHRHSLFAEPVDEPQADDAQPVPDGAFLHDGRVEMDSNFVENRIRPIKLTAKNALFAGHDEGARSWGRVASLIETCKMNGVEPYAWFKDTLEKIAAGHPNSRIDELLPWSFKPPSS